MLADQLENAIRPRTYMHQHREPSSSQDTVITQGIVKPIENLVSAPRLRSMVGHLEPVIYIRTRDRVEVKGVSLSLVDFLHCDGSVLEAQAATNRDVLNRLERAAITIIDQVHCSAAQLTSSSHRAQAVDVCMGGCAASNDGCKRILSQRFVNVAKNAGSSST